MTILEKLRRLGSRLQQRDEASRPNASLRDFVLDSESGLKKRDYSSYEEYLDHQRSKLNSMLPKISQWDNAYEAVVAERYASLGDWRGRRLLCLAARLGGEVRAFKRLGALAIGIDIEPGHMNQHVLYGDFHSVQFPDHVFDVAFTNALDHVYDLPRFADEVTRLLTSSGSFYVELADHAPGDYESLDTANTDAVIKCFRGHFSVQSTTPIINVLTTESWSGQLIHFRPLS